MPVAKANGKTFTFPEGTTPEQMGEAIDEFFESQAAPVKAAEPSRFANLPMRPGVNPYAAQQAAQASDKASHERSLDMERLRAENPYLADEIESMGGIERFLVGAGGALTSIGRGVGLVDAPGETEKTAFDALKRQSYAAQAGEIVGHAAPFMAPAGVAANIASLPARLGVMGGLGATEGAVISKGEGGSAQDVVQGAGIGLLAGAGGEILGPVLRGVGRRTVNAPEAPIPEMQGAVLQADVAPPKEQISLKAPSAEDATNLTQRIAKGTATPQDVAPDIRSIKAAERLGLKNTPVAVTSNNPAFRGIYGQMSVIPGSKQSVEMDQFFKDIQQVSDGLVEEMGGSLEKADVSDRFRAEMQNLVDGARAAEKELYDQIEKGVDKAQPVDTSGVAARLESMATELGGAKELAELNPAAAKLLDTAKKGMTYGYLDEQIKLLNEAKFKSTSPYANFSSYRRDQVIDALTQARQGFLEAQGLGEVAEKARAATIAKKDIQAKQLKLLGKQKIASIVPKVTASIRPTKVASGDLKAFDELMANMPEELKPEVIATALDGVLRKSGNFNATQFSQWYESLMRSPESRNRIFKHLPKGAPEKMNDLYRIAKGLSQVQADRVKTGRVQTIFNDLDKQGGIIDKIKGTAGKVAAAEGLTSAVGIPGAGTVGVLVRELSAGKTSSQKAADDFLSSEAFRQAVIDYATNGNVTDFQTAKLSRSKEFKAWLETQPADARNSILSLGLLPWLLAEDEQP